jgi:hypothetical protein
MARGFNSEEVHIFSLMAQSLNDLCPDADWMLPQPDYSSLIWESPDIDPPSLEEIEAQMVINQQKHDDTQWLRDRTQAYPSVTDQLDMMYHANALPQELQDLLRSVKETYPKPTGL